MLFVQGDIRGRRVSRYRLLRAIKKSTMHKYSCAELPMNARLEVWVAWVWNRTRAAAMLLSLGVFWLVVFQKSASWLFSCVWHTYLVVSWGCQWNFLYCIFQYLCHINKFHRCTRSKLPWAILKARTEHTGEVIESKSILKKEPNMSEYWPSKFS